MKSHNGNGVRPARKCRYCPGLGGFHHHGCCTRSPGKKMKSCRCVKCRPVSASDPTLDEFAVSVIVSNNRGIGVEKLLTELRRQYGCSRNRAMIVLSGAMANRVVVARDGWSLFLPEDGGE